MLNLGSDYELENINYLRENIRMSINELGDKVSLFDTIVCTGMSGLLVAPSLADHFHKNLVVLRKPCDRNHHSSSARYRPGLEDNPHQAEGELQPDCRWVFVDDFLCSGETFQRAFNHMQSYNNLEYAGRLYRNTCVGIFQYKHYRYQSVQELLHKARDGSICLFKKTLHEIEIQANT